MDALEDLAPKEPYQVAAFYCFVPLQEKVISSLVADLINHASKEEVKGTVLVAEEGVNGTICGSRKGVSLLLERLQKSLVDKTIKVKVSWTETQAFRRWSP